MQGVSSRHAHKRETSMHTKRLFSIVLVLVFALSPVAFARGGAGRSGGDARRGGGSDSRGDLLEVPEGR